MQAIDPSFSLGQQARMDFTMPESKAKPQNIDGRRARSQDSRQRIVDAMMNLISHGEMMPSAARVADEAGIGLRSVFRHFDDMDAIYGEIISTVSQQVLPIAMQPFADGPWQARVREIARRRAKAFEIMLPFRLAAEARRYASPLLLGQYAQTLQLERELVLRQLPEEVKAQRLIAESICTALSFQNWRALRHDQLQTAEDAAGVTMHMINSLIASLPESAE